MDFIPIAILIGFALLFFVFHTPPSQPVIPVIYIQTEPAPDRGLGCLPVGVIIGGLLAMLLVVAR